MVQAIVRSVIVKEDVFPGLLELIHGAALNPAGWTPVLRRLAALTGCTAGGLTLERPATRQGEPLTYFGFDSTHVERTFDHYLPMNPLFRIEPKMQRGFVVANGDVVPLDVFRRSEFYHGWARPQGLCSPVTVVIHRDADSYVPLTLVRPDGAGEVTAGGRTLLRRLAPHLVHAMSVTVRLQVAARHAAAPLEALPGGALLLDRDRRVVFANAHAAALLAENRVILAASGVLALRDAARDRAFQAALNLALGTRPRATRLGVPGPDGQDPLALTITPLPRRDTGWSALAHDASAQARCLVLVAAPPSAELARRCGLTPAETRLLAAVLRGKGLTAAARQLGIARSTAQSHLDKIFQKTGTNRQTELVALAGGTPPP